MPSLFVILIFLFLIGISETWLHKDISDYYTLENYNSVHRCRECKIDGVTLYVNNYLEYTERPDIDLCLGMSGEAVFIETNCTIIGCINEPPNSKISDFISYLTNTVNSVP